MKTSICLRIAVLGLMALMPSWYGCNSSSEHDPGIPRSKPATLFITVQNPGTSYWLSGVWAVDRNTVWAVGGSQAGDAGVILKTSDGGQTWETQLSDNIPTQYSVAASDQNVAWSVGETGDVLHTVDGGDTWSVQASLKNRLWKIFAVSDKVVWTVGDYAVFKTTDGGDSWLSVNIPHGFNIFLGLCLTDEKTVWISSRDGTILKSMDAGATWTAMDAPIDDGWFLWDIAAVDANRAWLATVDEAGQTDPEPGRGNIYGTVDGGATWQIVYSGEKPDYLEYKIGCFKALAIPRGWGTHNTPVFSVFWFVNPYSIAFSPNGMSSSTWHPYQIPPSGIQILYGLSSIFYEQSKDSDVAVCWGVGGLGPGVIVRMEFEGSRSGSVSE